MTHEGHQQQLEERAQTECPACGLRPIGSRYVYVRRGDLWPKEYRCDPCMDDATSIAADSAIRQSLDNVRTMGNPWGTQRHQNVRDRDGNITDTMRII